MDEFLAAVGVQAMRYAIRSGIALTSTYALGQCSRLLKTVDDKSLYSELKSLQKLLDSKIKIISPAIDLVEFKSGRGNVFLESAVPLTKSLHQQIISLGRRIEAVAALKEEAHKADGQTARKGSPLSLVLHQVVADIKSLLDRIDREIPLLQLAITASGESLSTSLPASISPSRLLQASTLLIVGDTQFAQDPTRPVQIGPAFHLSLYMLFLGHASPKPTTHNLGHGQSPGYGLGDNERKPLWQEVMHKARVRLCRSAQDQQSNYGSDNGWIHGAFNTRGNLEYAYHLEIIEDLDDGRLHDQTAAAASYDGVSKAGARETIPIYQLSKIFYTDTGKILNLGNAEDGEKNPVLLLKRDVGAARLSQANGGLFCSMMNGIRGESDGGLEHAHDLNHDHDPDHDHDEQADIDRQLKRESSDVKFVSLKVQETTMSSSSQLPKHFDAEWIALEVYEGDEEGGPDHSETDDGSESEPDDSETKDRVPTKTRPAAQRASLDSKLAAQIRNLSLQPSLGFGESPNGRQSSAQSLEVDEAGALDFVARSPFRAITSSLSLIEMLIRLAGLQEFQQASHLSLPDHVLTFFLEETSTTGLSGEARRTVRNEAKRHVGFDPYTDTAAE